MHFRKTEHLGFHTHIHLFILYVTRASAFSMRTHVSQLCRCVHQFFRFLTSPLLLNPPWSAPPSGCAGSRSGRKARKQNTCMTKVIISLSELLTVRSPTSSQLNAVTCQAQYALAARESCISILFSPSTFLHVDSFASPTLQDLIFHGYNDHPVLKIQGLDLEAGPLWVADSCMKAPTHLFLDVPQDPQAQLLISMPPPPTPHHLRTPQMDGRSGNSKWSHSTLPHLPNSAPQLDSKHFSSDSFPPISIPLPQFRPSLILLWTVILLLAIEYLLCAKELHTSLLKGLLLREVIIFISQKKVKFFR